MSFRSTGKISLQDLVCSLLCLRLWRTNLEIRLGNSSCQLLCLDYASDIAYFTSANRKRKERKIRKLQRKENIEKSMFIARRLLLLSTEFLLSKGVLTLDVLDNKWN